MDPADPPSLRPYIKEILRRDDVDLESISGKRVRQIIANEKPNFDVVTHKKAIDQEILSCFNEVREEDDEESSESDGTPLSSMASEPPANKKVKKEDSKAITDEEYARKLQAELNAQTRPSRNSNSKRKKESSVTPSSSRSGRKKKFKSDEFISDSDEDSSLTPNPTRARKHRPKDKPAKDETKKKRNSNTGFNKVCGLSPALAEIVGEPQLSRPQVVKRLWQYIKENELQDPRNGNRLILDDSLKGLFGQEVITSFSMNKLLTKHIYSLDEV